jgi:hypothetical protein
MNRNTLQHIHQVGRRIDTLHLTGHNQTLDNSDMLRAQFGPAEHPVFAIMPMLS